MMTNDIIENAVIDPNLDSYEKFFDHDWSECMFEAVRNSPLKDAVETVMVAWRSVNGAHLLPWLMIQSLKLFAEGKSEGSLGFRADYSGKVIDALVDKLESRMQFNLKYDQRVILRRVVTQIEREAFEAMKAAQAQCPFDVPGYWRFLAHNTEFSFCILGTQRVNYGSLFFAYEDFLANTIRTREPTYTSKKEPIKDAFPRYFGNSLADFCWNHDEVDLARLVRHTLVHNGGRFGADLQKYEARFLDVTGTSAPLLRGEMFLIVDGKIQIMPCNTRHLFGILKERLTKVVEELT
jgi:hypothetical protein